MPSPRAGKAPEDSSDEPAGGSTSRFSPRNWRVPTRLNAILLIPALVGLVMGGYQVKESIDTWNEARDAEETALVVRAAAEYGQALLNERDLTAQPLLSNKRTANEVEQARAITDEAASKFDTAVRDMPDKKGLNRRLELFRVEEPLLPELRKAAYAEAMDPVKTEEGYTKVQHSLMEFSNELGLGTRNITSDGRTLYALELAKAAESLQRSIGTHLLVRPSQKKGNFDTQVKSFGSYNYLEQIALNEFVSGGTEADSARLREVMAGKAAEGAKQLKADKAQAGATGQPFVALPGIDGLIFDGMAQQIGRGQSPSDLKEKGITPDTWMAAATAKFDGYTTIEDELVDKAVTEAAQISAGARTDAIVNAAIVLIALLAAFIVTGLMARQMSRSMRRLRTAAFSVAEQRLPILVDQLSRTEPCRVDTRVKPIPINSRDEIGEVARAFDQVHQEAVRLAAEQAMLRGNVNAIFTNLSRRNQPLIEGQLTVITELESSEANPEHLERLFKLDHLATRMRRNGENLLVLAGEEPGRRWNQPVPLVDVLRAASSEVEFYERIELTGVPESEIHGQAVTDLVHLLAELLENATTFSSPQTKVRVTATRLPDGRVVVEIHDKGIGLTPEDFAEINHKLANPPTVDAAASQRMGLFVVGRLADRHGISVQLRPSGEQAGTTSLVMLPDALTHGGGGDPVPADDFSVPPTIAEQLPEPVFDPMPHHAPMRTAAELGFDDSRYETSVEDSPQLAPVNRSLMREGRRAALEAQSGAERPAALEAGTGAGLPAFQADAQTYAQDQYAREQYGQEPYVPDQYAAGEQSGQQLAQPGYQQPAYEGGHDAYGTDPGHQQPQQPQPSQHDGYNGYTEAPDAQQERYANSFLPQPEQSQQVDWPDQSGYQAAYDHPAQAEAESVHSAPAAPQERVGFDQPGPVPSDGHDLTSAGLPRRGAGQQHWQPSGGGNDRSTAVGQPQRPPQQPPAAQTDGESLDDWRSTNDERWERADKLREPKAGGITPSGLPRRVPKANLVEGTAEQTQQGGPQVSRAPEDIRGRLSNLRRGVQRGRTAGSDTSNTYNQER